MCVCVCVCVCTILLSSQCLRLCTLSNVVVNVIIIIIIIIIYYVYSAILNGNKPTSLPRVIL